MKRRWPFFLLVLALVGALVWGYGQTVARQRLALQVENQFQQAFHKLTWRVENVDAIMTRLAATSSKEEGMRLLSDLRVNSQIAVEDLSQLPFASVPLIRTEKFLNDTKEFAETLSADTMDGKAVTDGRFAQLQELQGQARYLKGELHEVIALIGPGRQRFSTNQRLTGMNSGGGATNPLTKTFESIDKLFKGAPQGPPNLPPQENRAPKGLIGPAIDTNGAVTKATQFLGQEILKGATPQVQARSRGDFVFYHLVAATPTGRVVLDLSEIGGWPIYMLNSRPVAEPTIDLNEGAKRGAAFLQSRGFANMRPVSGQEYRNIGLITYVPVQNNVLVYPDIVRLRVALDNGEIIGFEATDYLRGRDPNRKIPGAKLTPEQAKARVSKRLTVEGNPDMALILNRENKEVLTYRFMGRMDKDRYQVFINAITGDEERVLMTQGQM